MESGSPLPRVQIELAEDQHRELIYAARHEIYGLELGQHHPNPGKKLTDALDEFNTYIIAREGDRLLAFVSLTPPASSYSIDKYFDRACVPARFDETLFEIRLLTVMSQSRGSLLASAMMYAALRYVEEHGGKQIVAIGRREVLDLYLKSGLRQTGLQTHAGKVTYELLVADVADIRNAIDKYDHVVKRIENQCQWNLRFSFRPVPACLHGGAFWDAVGDDFKDLEKLHQVISADVLDAWFPPAPEVVSALANDLPKLIQTSPPTDAGGLVRTIAEARGISTRNVLPAAGSSELIYLAFSRWLTSQSRVLVIDPSYGEYIHLLETVIGCKVDRLRLRRGDDHRLDLHELQSRIREGYDLAVLVNPNSPTGTMISRRDFEEVLRNVPARTRVWIDETYIEYAGVEHSLERYAAGAANVFVCKSMSKVYALSGLRVAYLVGNSGALAQLRAFAPPWAVSLPAQVAAVAALKSTSYYEARYRQTVLLREQLISQLCGRFGFSVTTSCANFLLCHIPQQMPRASEIREAAQQRGVYFRDAGTISRSLGDHCLRIAVKDSAANARILDVLTLILGKAAGAA